MKTLVCCTDKSFDRIACSLTELLDERSTKTGFDPQWNDLIGAKVALQGLDEPTAHLMYEFSPLFLGNFP